MSESCLTAEQVLQMEENLRYAINQLESQLALKHKEYSECYERWQKEKASLEEVLEAGANINYHLNYLVNALVYQALGSKYKMENWNSDSTARAMEMFDKTLANHEKIFAATIIKKTDPKSTKNP